MSAIPSTPEHQPHHRPLEVTEVNRRRSWNLEMPIWDQGRRSKIHVAISRENGDETGRVIEVSINGARKCIGGEREQGWNWEGRLMTKALQAHDWESLDPPQMSGRIEAGIGGKIVKCTSVREAVWLLVREEIEG